MTTPTLDRTFPVLPVEAIALHPDNLRDTYRGIPELAASIAEVGVLQPLIVVPVDQIKGHEFPPEITHVVVDGHRRLLAAQSRPEIKHVLCDLRPDLASAREAHRTMAVSGMARDDLTAREQAKAVQLLLDLGWTQAQVARSTGRKPAEVKVAKAAAQLDTTVAEEYAQGLTIKDMAALVEFQDDRNALAFISKAATEGRTDHAVERLRQERSDAADKARLTAEYEALGYRVTNSFGDDGGVPIHELVDVTPENHESCLGRIVYLQKEYGANGAMKAFHRCADPEKFGHTRRWGGPKPAATEKDKADRKLTIERNKDMAAAEVVRRNFLRDVRESKVHADAQVAFALSRLLRRDDRVAKWMNEAYTRQQSHAIYVEITGMADPDEYLWSLPPHKAGQALWIQVVTAIEHATQKDAWQKSDNRRDNLAVYLEHLAAMGYVWCDTERFVVAAARQDRLAAEKRAAKKSAS